MNDPLNDTRTITIPAGGSRSYTIVHELLSIWQQSMFPEGGLEFDESAWHPISVAVFNGHGERVVPDVVYRDALEHVTKFAKLKVTWHDSLQCFSIE